MLAVRQLNKAGSMEHCRHMKRHSKSTIESIHYHNDVKANFNSHYISSRAPVFKATD